MSTITALCGSLGDTAMVARAMMRSYVPTVPKLRPSKAGDSVRTTSNLTTFAAAGCTKAAVPASSTTASFERVIILPSGRARGVISGACAPSSARRDGAYGNVGDAASGRGLLGAFFGFVGFAGRVVVPQQRRLVRIPERAVAILACRIELLAGIDQLLGALRLDRRHHLQTGVVKALRQLHPGRTVG